MLMRSLTYQMAVLPLGRWGVPHASKVNGKLTFSQSVNTARQQPRSFRLSESMTVLALLSVAVGSRVGV